MLSKEFTSTSYIRKKFKEQDILETLLRKIFIAIFLLLKEIF